MTAIVDPDVRALAIHSATLRADYGARASSWEGSPFAWIRTLPSASRGAVGAKLLSGWLATKGFDVERSPDSQADRIVNGVRAEFKFSTLWEAGFYKFQQLRDQDYRFAVCLGLSPMDAHCWVIPKRAIFGPGKRAAGLIGQHGGAKGKETAWLTVAPEGVPEWLGAHGGRLAEAAKRIEALTGRKRLK